MNPKMKRCLQTSSQTKCSSAVLLFLRLVVGVAFLYHGWGKMQSPFGWMPAEAPVPGFFQFLAAFSEFGGGLSLVLGLLTPLAMLGLSVTMAVATLTHMLMLKDPFVNTTGGSSYELALVYFAISLLFLVVGPGLFSLDAKIFGERS